MIYLTLKIYKILIICYLKYFWLKNGNFIFMIKIIIKFFILKIKFLIQIFKIYFIIILNYYLLLENIVMYNCVVVYIVNNKSLFIFNFFKVLEFNN